MSEAPEDSEGGGSGMEVGGGVSADGLRRKRSLSRGGAGDDGADSGAVPPRGGGGQRRSGIQLEQLDEEGEEEGEGAGDEEEESDCDGPTPQRPRRENSERLVRLFVNVHSTLCTH